MPTKNPTLSDLARELGYDPAHAKMLPIKVRVEPYDDVPEVVLSRLSELDEIDWEEATSPITTTGKPRMLKLTAWLAHAGPANANGDAFLAADLQAVAAEGLFTPPYIGMVDFNHDFMPYGAWYSARYEFDPQANEFGLLAEGTIFAWRFEELADKILAHQVRNGHIDVSMACICENIETRTGESGATEFVLRKPVFLAVSILDVDGADPNARAVGDERVDSTELDRTQELNQATLLEMHALNGTTLTTWAATAQANKIGLASHTTQEEMMDLTEVIEQLTEAMGDRAVAIVAALQDTLAEAARVPVLEAQLAELVVELEASSESLVDAQAAVEAANVALEAVATELAELTSQYETLDATHADLVADLEESDRAAVLETRLEMLPEIYITVLEARDDEARELTEGRFANMSDEEWEAELELLTAGSPTSYTERSRREGGLSSAAGSTGGNYAVDEFLN